MVLAGEKTNTYRNLEEKIGRKEAALRVHKWEELKTYFKEVRWEAVRLVDLVQGRGK
jgi:uncharacterized protein YqfB (UPF0267 family)